MSSSVSEMPVEQKVTLREEHVEAERKSADRKLGADEAEAAFEEKTVEVMGTREEAEVQKEARVVGEGRGWSPATAPEQPATVLPFGIVDDIFPEMLSSGGGEGCLSDPLAPQPAKRNRNPVVR